MTSRPISPHRNSSQRRRLEIASANVIQGCVRRCLARIWAAKRAYAALLRRSATQIQRMYRGKIDRERHAKRVAKQWYECVYIPAIIFVQSKIRAYHARVFVRHLRRRVVAAILLQRLYRKYRKRLEVLARWRAMRLVKLNAAAIIMQKYLRRMFARMRYRRVK